MTATGTCPRCRVEQPIDEGYIDEHDRAIAWRAGVPYRFMLCEGAGHRPLEFTAAARATRDRRLAAQVVAARDQAGVTLDAWLAKHGGTAHGESVDRALLEVPKLLKLAAKLGVLTWPIKAAASRNAVAKSTRWWSQPWWAVNRRQIHTKSGRTRRGLNADLYCVFCGDLVLADADCMVTIFLRKNGTPPNAYPMDLADRVIAHTTPCALACLAGLRTPVAPGTKRLPSDVRQEERGV